MANRRMMAKSVIETDKFMDMPMSTQCLYFHLLLRADDEGFLQNAKSIIRLIKCGEDDMKLLIAKQFIIPFESGVIVIKHWKIHNYIARDRLTTTQCTKERGLLTENTNKEYELKNTLYTKCIQDVYKTNTQVRLGKVRLDKVRLDKEKDTTIVVSQKKTTKKFIKPTVEEVQAYIDEKGYSIDSHCFIDYYESNGWKVGRNSMKNWKATVRNWARNKKTATLQAKVKADWEKDWSNEKDGWEED